MKKSSILILIIICLVGCKKISDKVNITGEINGLGTDTIYLYGMDESYDQIDTIYAKDSKFSFTTKVDTVISAYLLFNNRTEYPIFFDKGNKITIKGDIANPNLLSIDGNIYNEEFSKFQKELGELGNPSAEILEQKAEEFIQQHHSSYVSLYLLDKYFVQKDAPDFNKIKKLIEVMTGVLQDKSYIDRLNETMAQAEKTEIGKYAPFFTLPNEGEKISRSSEGFKDKNILINFWASWGDSISNQQNNKELKALYQTYKKSKYLNILGISLDIDKQQWKNAIKRDSLSWEQVCDFNGMNSDIAKQYSIKHLPSNVLLSPEGKIVAKNLHGQELKKKLEEVVIKAEEKEKNSKKKNNR